MSEITLKIEGMSCGGCVGSVEKALERVGGVREITVDLKGGTAVVRGADLDPERLVAAVYDAGYDASIA